MTDTNTINTHHLLTLKQIASWQIPGIENRNSEIIARVPSLQRGAVWEPQQIEMLWDSIMRGFPIGSIVIAKKINEQRDKSQITSATDSVSNIETSHHILDGQQRCNAIAWGFVDPWDNNSSDDIVLWLDLKPGIRVEKNTTRKYLFRVTTKAHPWGFHYGDQAGNLSVSDIGKFKERLQTYHQPEKWPSELHRDLIISQDFDDGKIKRPTPKLAAPYDAGFPVPMFLLFKYFDSSSRKLNWEMLAHDKWMKIISAWSELNVLSLDDDSRKYIELGLTIADQACMIALQVPDIIKGIDDIEQIFQRLNLQGTPLDNEELAYSLIKAYWTDVDEIIRKLPHHTTEARLVGLGVRVALTDSGSKKLVPEQSVDRIRNIFRPNIVKNEDKIAKEQIESFFKNDELKKTLNWIDDQFLYNEKSRDYGLPVYLRSSIAWHSRDVFAWLMLLAKRNDYKPINDHELVKKIIGLALTIHWFGEDKAKAADLLVDGHHDLINLSISKLNTERNPFVVRVPLSPEEIGKCFQLDEASEDIQLKNWKDFWQGVVNYNDKGVEYLVANREERANKYCFFINKLRNQRELLVYVQREYIESVFKGFDPSNKLMWKGHNRPWDYDHILPSQSLNAQGRGAKKYLSICQSWQQSIGNLVAVDFSFNRSAQHTVNAREKYEQFAEENKFKIYSDNLQDFIMELEDADDAEKSKKFVLAVKNRFIEIYKTWYESFEIEKYRTL